MTKNTTQKIKTGEIKTNIEIKQLVLDSDFRWKLKMIVGKLLETSYHCYTVKMVFDDDPYAKKIAELKKENRLIVSEMKEEVKKITEAMEEAKENCPEIEFVAMTEQLKYGAERTEISLNIPDDIIDSLNQHKRFLKTDYVVKLIPYEK